MKKTCPFVSTLYLATPTILDATYVCAKKFRCCCQGAAVGKDHIASQSHKKLAKTLATQPRFPFLSPVFLTNNEVHGINGVANFRLTMQTQNHIMLSVL